ncbi:MAG: hypothetical protein MZV63_06035 [Marinilabiliales bacterium]|nr:hypothetical protein [Marinilabiliales bacterium]
MRAGPRRRPPTIPTTRRARWCSRATTRAASTSSPARPRAAGTSSC